MPRTASCPIRTSYGIWCYQIIFFTLLQKNYETQAALTVEVAEKHDQMLELRREMHLLEEQVKNAHMQTHFKDNIIREMRNELKVARNKVRCYITTKWSY